MKPTVKCIKFNLDWGSSLCSLRPPSWIWGKGRESGIGVRVSGRIEGGRREREGGGLIRGRADLHRSNFVFAYCSI